MKNHFLLSLLICLLLGNTILAQVNELPRSTPEREGVPSYAVSALLDSLFAIPQTDIHSVMVLRHGKVIAEVYPEPFKAEYQHTQYSCSKTFVSAAVGLAVDANLLRVTDRVATFFPDKLPTEVTPELASMTIHDLLIMASGIDPDGNLRAENTYWLKPLLAKTVQTPGKLFKYDSLCTYMLSAIVQQVTGKTIFAYLQEKLFKDLHIEKVSWEESPEGITTGGWGLFIQPESLAKMGQLLLQKGRWNGKQLLSEAWVSQMMTTHIDTGGGRGYGYQMWEASKDGAFRADGRFGQYIVVMPKQDMVVVITQCSNAPNPWIVSQVLAPAVQDEALMVDKGYQVLQKQLQRYSYPTVSGKAKSKLAKLLANKTFKLSDNQFGWKDISILHDDKQLTIVITDQQGFCSELSAGYKHWNTTWTPARPPYSMNAQQKFKGIEGPFAVAACYGWTSSNTLHLNFQYVNWISALDLTLTFQGDTVQIMVHKNYEPDVPQFNGRA
ncbi:MAG: serine hydrolase [Bacteroidaceae bacterium]|nr:serine hydrolase [Bacteroidaceae bacterium]